MCCEEVEIDGQKWSKSDDFDGMKKRVAECEGAEGCQHLESCSGGRNRTRKKGGGIKST